MKSGKYNATRRSEKNLLKLIRKNCLKCVCENSKEVELCTGISSCVFYPYRFGRNPMENDTKFVSESNNKYIVNGKSMIYINGKGMQALAIDKKS